MSRLRRKRVVTPAFVGCVAMVTAATVALATSVPQTVSRNSVELAATITPGSATNWHAEGIDAFYGIDWNGYYGDTAIAPFRLVQFWQGAENILAALDAHAGEKNVVVSSGRGAGNASATITWLALTDPDGARLNDTFWILDNNVDRPNGGYATRYPFFALVGVNPVPVLNNLDGVEILDVGYEYAWNSSAPTYISNVPGLLNAIIAYAYRYRQQDKLPIPAEILDPETGALVEEASGHYIVGTDGTVISHEPVSDGVTTVYVTYEVDGLPMLKPIRDFGGDVGNAVADVVEPVLTVLVNASYTDNDPFADPSVYTPMQLFAPPKVWATAAEQLPGAIAEGWDKLQEHLGGGPEEPATPAGDQPATSETAPTVEADEKPTAHPDWRADREPAAELVSDAVDSVKNHHNVERDGAGSDKSPEEGPDDPDDEDSGKGQKRNPSRSDGDRSKRPSANSD